MDIHILSTQLNNSAVCQYCGEEITSEPIICPVCRTPHHADCWKENGNRCTIYGCAEESSFDTECSRIEHSHWVDRRSSSLPDLPMRRRTVHPMSQYVSIGGMSVQRDETPVVQPASDQVSQKKALSVVDKPVPQQTSQKETSLMVKDDKNEVVKQDSYTNVAWVSFISIIMYLIISLFL